MDRRMHEIFRTTILGPCELRQEHWTILLRFAGTT